MSELSARHREVFEGVVGHLEAAAARGERYLLVDVFPLVGCTQSEWSAAVYKVRTLGVTDLLQRFNGIEGRSKGRALKRPWSRAKREQERDPMERTENDVIARLDARAIAMAAIEECRVSQRITPGLAKASEQLAKDLEEIGTPADTRYLVAMDHETAALVKVIETLRSLPSKDARDRVLGAASVMLNLE